MPARGSDVGCRLGCVAQENILGFITVYMISFRREVPFRQVGAAHAALVGPRSSRAVSTS
jgi:hypothetical protein